MLVIGVIIGFSFIWILFEGYQAPTVDNNERILKPGKKISDLWRRQQ
jgi:hypothetical protein